MKVLAVDTSSILASACLLNGKKALYSEDSNNITHSEKLLKLINNVMESENIKVKDLDYLMVTNGPGSFTGARIGAVTIKGLALPFDKKIIAVTSLETIAFSEYLALKTDEEKAILALLDAKNDRAYYGLFKFEKKNSKVVSTQLLDISNDTLENIKEKMYNYANILVVTDIPEKITEEFEKMNFNILNKKCKSNAAQLTNFFQNANKETLSNHVTDAYYLDIIYARQSQAERVRNGEN